MNNTPAFSLWRFLACALVLVAVTLGSSIAPAIPDLPQGQDEVPYGAASDYLVGRQLMKEGNFAEALGYLHLVYRTHPDVPAIAVDFQEALVAEGYFQDALGVMDKLVSAYPDSLNYLFQRSRLNIKLNKTDEALKDLRRLREKGGTNLEVIMAEANVLAARGDLNQALDVFRDGIEELPAQGDKMYLGMASLYQRDNQTEALVPLLQEAVRAYPDNPDLWVVWMRALALTGRHDDALDAARQADARFSDQVHAEPVTDPEHSESAPPSIPSPDSYLVELADFYVQQGQVARAVSILKSLSANDELDVTPSLWLARIYLGTGQDEACGQLVEEILVKWPGTARAWFLKGKLQENQGEWVAAIPLFRQAVDLDPTDPEIRLAYVRSMLVGWEKDLSAPAPDSAQREKRQVLEAQAVAALDRLPQQDAQGHLVLGYAFRTLDDPWRAESSFALAARSPDLRIVAMTQRSLCFDEMGDPEKSRQVLEELQEEFPQHPEVANSLGYFLAEKGQDLDRAVTLIQIALDTDPGNGAYLDSMGWALFRQGKVESAFDYMIQAVNVLPDDPVILEHLGMVLLELGQHQEAVGMLNRSLALGGDQERIGAALARINASQSGESSSAPDQRAP